MQGKATRARIAAVDIISLLIFMSQLLVVPIC
jgi:hypothetical protein